MCYNCGCQNPDDNMGSDDNITNNTFESLSKQSGKSSKETKQAVFNFVKDQLEKKPTKNKQFEEMFEKAAKAWGQSSDDAKRQAYRMLKSELKK